MAASSKKSTKPSGSKATTAPKGRPTAPRSAARSSRRLSPTMEWILAALALAVLIALLIFLFGDVRTTVQGLGVDGVAAGGLDAALPVAVHTLGVGLAPLA